MQSLAFIRCQIQGVEHYLHYLISLHTEAVSVHVLFLAIRYISANLHELEYGN